MRCNGALCLLWRRHDGARRAFRAAWRFRYPVRPVRPRGHRLFAAPAGGRIPRAVRAPGAGLPRGEPFLRGWRLYGDLRAPEGAPLAAIPAPPRNAVAEGRLLPGRRAPHRPAHDRARTGTRQPGRTRRFRARPARGNAGQGRAPRLGADARDPLLDTADRLAIEEVSPEHLEIEGHPKAVIVVDAAGGMLVVHALQLLPPEQALLHEPAVVDCPLHHPAQRAAQPEGEGKSESFLRPIDEGAR